jgi:hypothetical protein
MAEFYAPQVSLDLIRNPPSLPKKELISIPKELSI